MYDELISALRQVSEDWGARDFAEEPSYVREIIKEATDAIEELSKLTDAQLDIIKQYQAYLDKSRWIPVSERLPECEIGAEIGNVEWVSCGMVFAGCFGRGGKYRDAYFRTWTDAGEGMDAKDADYWRAVTLPKPPKEK